MNPIPTITVCTPVGGPLDPAELTAPPPRPKVKLSDVIRAKQRNHRSALDPDVHPRPLETYTAAGAGGPIRAYTRPDPGAVADVMLAAMAAGLDPYQPIRPDQVQE